MVSLLSLCCPLALHDCPLELLFGPIHFYYLHTAIQLPSICPFQLHYPTVFVVIESIESLVRESLEHLVH